MFKDRGFLGFKQRKREQPIELLLLGPPSIPYGLFQANQSSLNLYSSSFRCIHIGQ